MKIGPFLLVHHVTAYIICVNLSAEGWHQIGERENQMKYNDRSERPKDLLTFEDAVQTRIAFSDRRSILLERWLTAHQVGVTTQPWADAIQACTIAEENLGFHS